MTSSQSHLHIDTRLGYTTDTNTIVQEDESMKKQFDTEKVA